MYIHFTPFQSYKICIYIYIYIYILKIHSQGLRANFLEPRVYGSDPDSSRSCKGWKGGRGGGAAVVTVTVACSEGFCYNCRTLPRLLNFATTTALRHDSKIFLQLLNFAATPRLRRGVNIHIHFKTCKKLMHSRCFLVKNNMCMRFSIYKINKNRVSASWPNNKVNGLSVCSRIHLLFILTVLIIVHIFSTSRNKLYFLGKLLI